MTEEMPTESTSGNYPGIPDGSILIEYGVVPNAAPSGGWLPQTWYQGRAWGHTYGTGYSRADALAMAKWEAEDLLARHHGNAITERAEAL